MSTFTIYFCDECNSDHDRSQPGDDACAVTYSESPTYDGWALFSKPYTGISGYQFTTEYHVCAHCLADPEFDASSYGTVSEWDNSAENIEKGRAHAERFDWAREHLGTPDRWGMRGVRQVFGENFGGNSFQFGPRLADGRFSPADKVRGVAA